MHIKYPFSLVSGCALLCITSLADMPAQPQLVKSSVFIQGLNQTLTEVKKTAAIPVIFPDSIPKDLSHPHYYASYDKDNTTASKGYWINVDYTAECRGVHVCNIGYLHAEPGKEPEPVYSRTNKNITQTVTLADKIQGYYTPGHAMGSYFSPVIQWRLNGVLYTLSWNDHVADKAAVIAMANSAITPATQ